MLLHSICRDIIVTSCLGFIKNKNCISNNLKFIRPFGRAYFEGNNYLLGHYWDRIPSSLLVKIDRRRRRYITVGSYQVRAKKEASRVEKNHQDKRKKMTEEETTILPDEQKCSERGIVPAMKKETSAGIANGLNGKEERRVKDERDVKEPNGDRNEKAVLKKKIDKSAKQMKGKKEVKKKGTAKEGVVKSSISLSYAPIPKNIEQRWHDFNKIREYAKITNVYLGAHISASGGVQNAPINSFNISGLAFALFLKNQRKWDSAPLTSDNIKLFEENCNKYDLDKNFILPHGSYLINLANPDKEKREKSYMSFLDDIKRCEQLKIKLYNFHPGSTVGQCSLEEGIKNIADCINRAHQETSGVIIILENSAGQRNSVGSKFEHLRDIILQIKDKERIGVCLDTCHTFAAGYDIKTYDNFNKVMEQFDKIVNAKYLKAVHLNDSKSDIGSGLDRHENIGKGKLTLDTFKYIMTSKYFKNIPIILETPDLTNDESVYKYEIEYLYKLGLKQQE
ncbi:DNA-(apurinic or apyrimidinic site) lyase 1 [Plasmodium brasilianum]|uniref:Apurinic/apyrimidinic endonuclease Apn1, putative n=2 Tax=Plasmodium (Plasmodium) TaxID=418103 RepID=A0A1A8W5F4_PLAMA|nr:apurinic/apyrimidinic endonuclease Apn1, putative [Plasmodium malariae]KAI4836450.1 DNA-(apurinic or apyrimidinic site) lyase 1 [Plasmodium brasilianum]SBS88006.1 apurinic/apyrimidinic endonuclease Apn1, putative [Plasmodium malariae]SCO93725.1 apurinic/apyrimidinic endonuclease Apn1, putative [Plasmodium malariae]